MSLDQGSPRGLVTLPRTEALSCLYQVSAVTGRSAPQLGHPGAGSAGLPGAGRSCPECGAALVRTEGCMLCRCCGYSPCA